MAATQEDGRRSPIKEGIMELRGSVTELMGELFAEPSVTGFVFEEIEDWEEKLPDLAEIFPRLRGASLEGLDLSFNRDAYRNLCDVRVEGGNEKDDGNTKDMPFTVLAIGMDFEREDDFAAELGFSFDSEGESFMASEIQEKPRMFVRRTDTGNGAAEIVRLKLIKELLGVAIVLRKE